MRRQKRTVSPRTQSMRLMAFRAARRDGRRRPSPSSGTRSVIRKRSRSMGCPKSTMMDQVIAGRHRSFAREKTLAAVRQTPRKLSPASHQEHAGKGQCQDHDQRRGEVPAAHVATRSSTWRRPARARRRRSPVLAVAAPVHAPAWHSPSRFHQSESSPTSTQVSGGAERSAMPQSISSRFGRVMNTSTYGHQEHGRSTGSPKGPRDDADGDSEASGEDQPDRSDAETGADAVTKQRV